MSGHWEAEQYKEQLEASRTAHAACEAARREAQAEIDRLRTELAALRSGAEGARLDRWMAKESALQVRAADAEARLAAVIALCDETDRSYPLPVCWRGAELHIMSEEIRAAATGGTDA